MKNKLLTKNLVWLACSIAMGGEEDGAEEAADSGDAFSNFMDSLIDGTDDDDGQDDLGEEGEEGAADAGDEEEEEAAPVVVENPVPVEGAPAPVVEPVVQKPVEQNPELTDEDRAAIKLRQDAAYADLVREFEISEDDANMLLTAPEKVIPELLAKAYHKAMSDSMAMMKYQIDHTVKQLPMYMQNMTNSQTAEQEAAQEFYTINPELKDHSDTVTELLQPDASGVNPLVSKAKAILVSQGNANPTRADVMGMVGRAVSGLLGVSKPASVPQKRVVRNGAVHQPAAPGAATITVSSDKDVSKNETYISELLLEQ